MMESCIESQSFLNYFGNEIAKCDVVKDMSAGEHKFHKTVKCNGSQVTLMKHRSGCEPPIIDKALIVVNYWRFLTMKVTKGNHVRSAYQQDQECDLCAY